MFRKIHKDHSDQKLESSKFLEAQYYPTGQIQSNDPIIGILTQPTIDKAESATTYSTSLANTIIPASHVDFLQAAGARVIPLNYKLRPNALSKILSQINGVYIPGDQAYNLKNAKYMDAVETIMDFALDQKMGTKKHFPVMAVSYGYIASLIGLGVKSTYIGQVTSDLVNDMESLAFTASTTGQFNSYLFDNLTLALAQTRYKNVILLNEASQGILMKNFQKDRKLSPLLNPVATFDQPRKQPTDEYVAISEGITFPYFGIAYSIDLIQTNIDMTVQLRLKLSASMSILEAQRIANLFVDQTRLNANQFSRAADESSMLIGNYLQYLELINMASPSGDQSRYLTTAYVFRGG